MTSPPSPRTAASDRDDPALADQVAALREQIDRQRLQIRDEIRARERIVASLSWRLTRPLRSANTAVSRLRADPSRAAAELRRNLAAWRRGGAAPAAPPRIAPPAALPPSGRAEAVLRDLEAAIEGAPAGAATASE